MANRDFKFAILSLGLLLSGSGLAADTPDSLVGTYNGSQMEVGTELRLEADGRFEYYLSYGALDEIAQGTWTADAEAIVLTSDPVTPPKFELIGTEGGKRGTLTLTLDAGEIPRGLFEARVLMSDGTGFQGDFDDDGLVVPEEVGVAPVSIRLAFPVYEVVSPEMPIPAGVQIMHFRFVPNDLGTVAFDHQRLPRDGEAFVLERFDRTLKFRKERLEDEGEAETPGEE